MKKRGFKQLVTFVLGVAVLLNFTVATKDLNIPRAKADTVTFQPQHREPIGLDGMSHFERLPYFKNGVDANQVSSHDLTGGNNDAVDIGQGFNNYLYVDLNGEYVLMDTKGAGSIVRIWFTGAITGQTINIYFDGEETASVSMLLTDFFAGTNAPYLSPLVGNATVSSGGYYSYLPMPFKESVKVTTSSPPMWYNINYDTYDTDAGVTTFTDDPLSPDYFNPATVIDMWEDTGNDPKSTTGNISLTDTISINSGQSATIANISGSGSINSINFTLAPNTADILENTNIEMYWDDDSSPSVLVPFGQFFGNGAGTYTTAMNALPIGGNNSGEYYSYFPMPYAKSARIVIDNQSGSNITSLNYNIKYNTTPYIGLGNSAGYFKTQYNSDSVTTGEGSHDYTAFSLNSSKGQYVGITMTTTGDEAGTNLEGDERIYIDGSLTPQIQGTGTEDYFNGAFYFANSSFSLPVHGDLVKNYNEGDNTLQVTPYRFHLSDAIPFTKSIKVGFEHGPTDDCTDPVVTADYSSVAYYYALPDSGLLLTDTLDVGNATSESAHDYEVSGGLFNGSQEFSYEGDYNTDLITDTGRSFQSHDEIEGYSNFNMVIDTDNKGVKLRKRLDDSIINQETNVYVDDVLVGPWYTAGGQTQDVPIRWKDSDFEIPESFTTGKSSIEVKIAWVGSGYPGDDPGDVNEFRYWAYSYLDIDNETPVTTETPNPLLPNGTNGYYKGTSPTIDLTATDVGSEIYKSYYSWDGGEFAEYVATLIGLEGTHLLTYYSTDFAGNEEVSQTAEFKTDTISPNLTISSPTDGDNTSDLSVYVVGLTSDDTSGVATVTVNGDSATGTTNYSKNVPLSMGANLIQVIATDNAGNVTTRTITINRTSPIIINPALYTTVLPQTGKK